MNKKFLLILLFTLPLIGFSQQTRKIDSNAVFILDRMADIIGELESVNFYLETTTDRYDDHEKIISH